MNIILFDTISRNRLFPLTLTKAVADLRMGIFTIRERCEKISGSKVFVLTDEYLQPLYEPIPAGEYIFLDARIFPSKNLISHLTSVNVGEGLQDNKGLIGGRATIETLPVLADVPGLFNDVSSIEPVKRLEFPANLFQWNDELLKADFELISTRRFSASPPEGVHLTNPSQIFIEEGVDINFAILNASAGPIYIGKNAVVMESCSIRGPFALGEGSVMKMGTKVYGATSIGPYCTVGGEIKNSIINGYSNKAHDGYLGDSVIGEWCNLGAGTSNSNVKNTGGEVKLWNYAAQDYIASGNKCGVIMGDYSRTAINSSINTGTVVGVCCNVFGEGLTPKFISDFSWGANDKHDYQFDKAVNDISNWKKMKNKNLSETETSILKHIFETFNDNNLQ